MGDLAGMNGTGVRAGSRHRRTDFELVSGDLSDAVERVGAVTPAADGVGGFRASPPAVESL
jgi:hypothetical protein